MDGQSGNQDRASRSLQGQPQHKVGWEAKQDHLFSAQWPCRIHSHHRSVIGSAVAGTNNQIALRGSLLGGSPFHI